MLTDEVFEGYRESEGYALCRITPYENEFYGIKNHEILQMPIYNDFFFINFNEPPAPESVALQTRRTKGSESIAKIVASRALSKRTPSASLGVVFDFLKRTMVSTYEVGIIDPCKVTKCALQNAASAAGTLLTTSHAIVSA